MLKVGIGSKNPAKIEAVRAAFALVGYEAEVIGIEVPSGVSDQPFSDEETLKGAMNRAKAVLEAGDFDYGIGLEGGVKETLAGAFVCNWGAIAARTGEVGIGGGHQVLLPDGIVEQLKLGRELGNVIDEWIGKTDIKKKEGTIGILTKNHITRTIMFRDVVICALARFLQPSLYD